MTFQQDWKKREIAARLSVLKFKSLIFPSYKMAVERRRQLLLDLLVDFSQFCVFVSLLLLYRLISRFAFLHEKISRTLIYLKLTNCCSSSYHSLFVCNTYCYCIKRAFGI